MFEPLSEEPAVSAPPAPQQWRCPNCGYIHVGLQPPAQCPACGAPAERFEAVSETAAAAVVAAAAPKVVIVGAGIAGVAAAQSLRTASPGAEITLVSKEAELPYYRLNLTRYLAGEIAEQDLPMHAADWYQEQKVRLLLGVEAAAIHVENHVVELHGGERLPFDKLLLAAGADPFYPALSRRRPPGSDQPADRGRRPGDPLGVPGRGPLRLHRRRPAGPGNGRRPGPPRRRRHPPGRPRLAADAAIEPAAGRNPQSLRRHHRHQAADPRRHAQLVGGRRVEGVLLEDGNTLPAELVVIATGIRSSSHLARQAGLEVNQGVVVNNLLATSHPDILAAGDVAEHHGQVNGIWGPSQYQGSIAGLNLAGGSVEFGGVPRANTLKVLGLDLFSIGRIDAEGAGFQAVEQEAEGRYFRFVFQDNRLVGAVLLGDTSLTVAVQQAVEGKRDCAAILASSPTAAAIVEGLAAATR